MTADELNKGQKGIRRRIVAIAERKDLSSASIDPIFDGVGDTEAYLASPLKVAWVLKEPYDDFDKKNRPCGGGWSIVDCFEKETAWKNPVWRIIAYVMEGFLTGKKWDDLPAPRWDEDFQSRIVEILKSVALINVSKMPAYKSSYLPAIKENYDSAWRDVVLDQLELCEPDVVIFGNTYSCFSGDEKPNVFQNVKEVSLGVGDRRYERYGDIMHYFSRQDRAQVLIDTYHPGRKGQVYVDGLINALMKAKRDLKK